MRLVSRGHGVQPADGAGNLAGPGPGAGEAEPQAPSAADDTPGAGEQPQPQLPGLLPDRVVYSLASMASIASMGHSRPGEPQDAPWCRPARPTVRAQRRGFRSGHAGRSWVQFELRSVEHFDTRAAARARVSTWIEEYNRHRRHSALGMMSPVEYQRALQARKAALHAQASPVLRLGRYSAMSRSFLSGHGSYREAWTGKISQIEVSTLSGEPRGCRR
jgi:hypothetical protein